jgi:tRNA pseudouridine55 synthase
MGADFTLKPKRVRISRIEPLGWVPPQLEVRLTVGPGTYIRAFARDLGAKLGVGGCIAALVREADGPFLGVESVTVDEIELGGVDGIRSVLYPPDFILGGLQQVSLTVEQSKAFAVGKGIDGVEIPGDGPGFIRVYDDVGFIGLGTANANGCLKPKKIIRAEGC